MFYCPFMKTFSLYVNQNWLKVDYYTDILVFTDASRRPADLLISIEVCLEPSTPMVVRKHKVDVHKSLVLFELCL